VLGRRLFAAFERRAGKIELITAGMPQDLSEERLAVDRSGEGGQDAWLLYRGAPVRGAGQLLHRTHSLMELLAWAHFNGVATGHSQVGVFADRKGVTAGDVLVSLRLLQQQFPGGRLDEVPLSRLERSPGQVRALLVVNAAADPFDELRRQGVYLTSDRTDPLDFGGRHLGLVRTLDYLSVNTWGEVHCGHYEGLEGLLGCLCDHLKASTDGMHPLEVRCLSAERGRQIGERVQALFEDAARRLGAAGGEPVYVLRAGGQYYALTRSGAAFTNSLLGDHSELMRHLGQPRRAGGPVLFDPAIGADSPLPAVFAYSRAGAVQLFYRPAAGEASVYVVDETGALAHQTLPFHDEESLLNQYRRFFDSVLFREQTAGDAAGEDDTGPRLLCYRLERDEQAGLRAVAVSPAIRASAPAYVDLQVLIERHGDGSRFTVYCDGREFSSLDHGEALLETVARHVVDLRRGRAGYPIYITDLDLSGTSERRRASGRLPTAVYLAYKRRIEALLNEALARL
jgi:adenylate cyclase class 1